MTEMSAIPMVFRDAVETLKSPPPRREIELSEIRPPKRLAPWTHALAAEASGPEGTAVTARLVLLHDPDGQPSWDGVLRLVAYLRTDVGSDLASDPGVPELGWSWLAEALRSCRAEHTALGGTVTVTSSARFGEIAEPEQEHELELRGSWTPSDTDLSAHARAFQEMIGVAAGLPPVGVSVLGNRTTERRRHV
ncbi:DUF3000 domain-containing protein [Actinopolyspora erythraea]|uniref:DUF3000 domain-containing protein n=1 Tax=Actinopolyspora erythraea TaxID=414996 RepID=A0A099D3W5_9ACTN|nr:DUF3000 domain-containing protein [Actinopolyspora erythraea]KGI80878.1 hypothetical protein IL38_13985 [Actinopolyspora erythraea]